MSDKFGIGKLNSKKTIESAISDIRGWLEKLGINRYDVKFDYDPRANIAIVNFKYNSKDYEFRSTAQNDCRLNMWAIEHVMEYKVRAHIMEIESFDTSMSPYLALGSSQHSQSTATVKQDIEAYVILGISPYASNEELQRHWKNVARTYHPDAFGTDAAKEAAGKIFAEKNEAWDKIKKERGIE